MYLLIVEVSQKQAYIFTSNELKKNIENSERIAWVTSSEYFEEVCGDLYAENENMVYSGGGHTVLSFADKAQAIAFNQKMSRDVLSHFAEMELFTKILEYDEKKSPGENLKMLTKALERKKSIRRNSFRQGSFGVEKIDAATLKPVEEKKSEKEKQKSGSDAMIPDGFETVTKFEELGGTENNSNFIAVVHIDGNGMGARVTKLYERIEEESGNDWGKFKEKIRAFSDAIDSDFKEAYREMNETVAASIRAGGLEELSLKTNRFPVRKIILSGDDVCFVSEGRIGIECAKIFIDRLREKRNSVDRQGYEACAGIAIVHRKYPFYRAYELAESLCSHAKRFCAGLDEEHNGASVSALDWHISFGELKDSVEEIREDYVTADHKLLELRPYIVGGDDKYTGKEVNRQYANFRKLMELVQKKEDGYARGKLKELRNVLKQGETACVAYLKFNKLMELTKVSYYDIFSPMDISGIGTGVEKEGRIFIKTSDGKERSIVFDALELADTFLPIEGRS